ncbi:hypothetical protein LIER_10413 [Lithospermum erythrorhizon]|uniref:Uncharacterized protein n=1 Tax=Lithospermum erythrorhizon TaxID=34254 RepID=A0AAV3PJD2_LITER
MATFWINRGPSVPLDFQISEQVWSLRRQKVLEEKEVGKEVTASVLKKVNAHDGARSLVPSKLHNLDHAPTPKSQPEDPFTDMPLLKEISSDEEETAVVERNSSVTSQEVHTPSPRRTERVRKPTHRYFPLLTFYF